MHNSFKSIIPLLLVVVGIMYNKYEQYSLVLGVFGLILVILFVYLYSVKGKKD